MEINVKTYTDTIPGYYAIWEIEKGKLMIYRKGYKEFAEMFQFILDEKTAFEKMEKFYKESKN
jgi:hypothetical protein